MDSDFGDADRLLWQCSARLTHVLYPETCVGLRAAARNAASAPRRVAGVERAARSVINKGGAPLRARAPSCTRVIDSGLSAVATITVTANIAEDNSRKRYYALGLAAPRLSIICPMSMPLFERNGPNHFSNTMLLSIAV
ncbi:unnamed protein product [Leptosia nina]|uniref:Uncharacterized protein n=1 Tax=Leptosia nina TaxID=320188 RepID=A0AAV1JX96_9NEOP